MKINKHQLSINDLTGFFFIPPLTQNQASILTPVFILCDSLSWMDKLPQSSLSNNTAAMMQYC